LSWVVTSQAVSSLDAAVAALTARFPDDAQVVQVAERLLARADRLPDEAARALSGALHEIGAAGTGTIRPTALCVFVGVLLLGDAEDYRAMGAFIRPLGHQRAGAALAAAGERLDDDPALPLTVDLIYALLRRSKIYSLVTAAEPDAEPTEVRALVADCFNVGYWVMMTGVDVTQPGTPVRTVEDAAALFSFGAGDLRGWRGQAALLAANPWAPYAADLQHLLEQAGMTVAAQRIEDITQVYRRRLEKHERLQVAQFIRKAVEESGLLQREFAQLVGTSASRLSTYMNGGVTPSAAMLLRIRRVARQLEAARRGLNPG